MSQTTLVGRMSSCASAIGPDLGLGDQAPLGQRLREGVVGVAEEPVPARPGMARSGRFGLRIRITTLSGSKSVAGDVGQLALRDPLVGRAQVLADIRPEVVDPAVQQRLRQPGRRALVAGEHADLLRGPDPVDDRLDRPAGQAGEVGVLPALLDPGEGKLHAADVRHDLEVVLAQPVAEVAGDPVEERVALADQHRPTRSPAPRGPAASPGSCRARAAACGRARPPAATGSAARRGSGRRPSGSAAPTRSGRQGRRRRSPGSPASIGGRSPPPSFVLPGPRRSPAPTSQ